MKTASRVLAISICCLTSWMLAQEMPSAQPATQPSAAQQAEPVSNGMQPGDSHARIVRLSEAEGRLVLDRGTGKPESTMQNMPIVERARLATGDGFAEVEFEDGSTLRLPPESQVDFPRLILRHSGAKATTVRLVKGTVYINLQRTKDNDFLVETGNTVMTVTPSTHMRLEMANGKATLTVFDGDVEMRSGSASTSVGKKHSVSFDPIAPPETVDVAKKVEQTPYDEWDKRSLEFHDHYMNAKGYSSSPYAYGISDLNYYGGFVNAGGCGTMWRPYFTSVDWDPYGNGVWAWYRGAGYSWVSPYPWLAALSLGIVGLLPWRRLGLAARSIVVRSGQLQPRYREPSDSIEARTARTWHYPWRHSAAAARTGACNGSSPQYAGDRESHADDLLAHEQGRQLRLPERLCRSGCPAWRPWQPAHNLQPCGA